MNSIDSRFQQRISTAAYVLLSTNSISNNKWSSNRFPQIEEKMAIHYLLEWFAMNVSAEIPMEIGSANFIQTPAYSYFDSDYCQ